MMAKREEPAGIGVFRLYTEKEKDSYIGALVAQFEKEKTRKKPDEAHLPFITLSRQFGCMALEVALQITERLNQQETSGPGWAVYDKEIVRKIAEDLHMKTDDYLPKRALTDAELDRLGEFLQNSNVGAAMNLEELDGFFAALIAGPELVPPSEYLPEVFGGEMSE